MTTWETNDAMRRLRDRVKKLDVGQRVEKLLDDTEREITAIRSSAEFKLAARTGNVPVFDDEIASIRTRAMREMQRIASEARGELEYLGPEIEAQREMGSFARQVGEETAARGWQRAETLLRAGIAASAVLELAKADGDREMLAGLERNAATWLRASAGNNFNDASVRRSIASVQAETEAATDPMIGSDGGAYREAAREFERRSRATTAWIDYGFKSARGAATGGDRIALAFEIGDVPTGPMTRPFNGVRGDATAVLESLDGTIGIGTTIG